jgi:PIN domain nuclease of toxin-antitoxin system
MTIRVVADTHAILWYLYNDALLSPLAASILESAEQAGDQIAIASITTALHLNLPVISRDRKIQSSIVHTIW